MAPSRIAVSIASTEPTPSYKRVNRLVDHRQQNAIDDEGREILRNCDRLVEVFDKGARRLESFVVRGDPANQLDQLHARHGIHEMNADETAWAIGDRRQRVIEMEDVLVATIASLFR